MSENSYLKEKLDFVSNLNGTSLWNVVNVMVTFPMINFFSVLFKVFLFGSLICNTQSFSYFWKSFLIDFVCCSMPLLCVVTVFSNYVSLLQYGLMAIIFILFKTIIKRKQNVDAKSEALPESMALEEKIVRLSISTQRLWVYLLTCVSILAVDFNIFPRSNAKTENFGISLMDLGVGAYIVIHSMKLIRNNSNLIRDQQLYDIVNLPKIMFKELKHSSFLILLGILRLISLKSTNYVEHITEYGIHWNFLFTIVFVKLLACPIQILTRGSAFRSFLLSIAISFNYQYFLTQKNFTAYLLNNSRRESFIDANKEGIFSCIGYLGIYMGGQAICFRLSSILNNKKTRNVDLKLCIECIFNLFGFAAFYFIMLLVTSSKVQNVSRRLCNVSFISFTLMMSSLLLALFMITILLMAKIYLNDKNAKSKEIIFRLSQTFSFAEIIDSKYIGLVNFLISNLLTGLVNLSMNTIKISDLNSFLIVSIYCLATYSITFLIYYKFVFSIKKKII